MAPARSSCRSSTTPASRLDDPNLRGHGPGARLNRVRRSGRPCPRSACQPVGRHRAVSFVPTVDLPTAGALAASPSTADRRRRRGPPRHRRVNALDPGGTAALGAPAPTVRTPTAADFGGDLTRVTTDPLPDPRLSADVDHGCAGGPGTVRAGRRLRPVQGDTGLRQGRASSPSNSWIAGRTIAVHPPRAVSLSRWSRRARPRGHRLSDPRPDGSRRGLGRRELRRGASARCRGSSSWMGTASSGRSTRGSWAAPTSTSSCRCWPRAADRPGAVRPGRIGPQVTSRERARRPYGSRHGYAAAGRPAPTAPR